MKKLLKEEEFAMIIAATSKRVPGGILVLRVRSNPLGALHIGHSIAVVPVRGLEPIKYKTVSDFLDAWDIKYANTNRIPVPFLKREIGLGNVVRVFAERFPLWAKEKFDGCEDRRAWLNMLITFVPRRRTC